MLHKKGSNGRQREGRVVGVLGVGGDKNGGEAEGVCWWGVFGQAQGRAELGRRTGQSWAHAGQKRRGAASCSRKEV